jgi:archaellum biogenesis protein FlaJ (TadC family)
VTARTATRLAWGSCAGTISLLGFAIVFGALTASPGAADSGGTSSLVASVVFVFAFATVGALVASRRLGNPIGWIMCASGLAYALGGVCVVYVESFDPGRTDLGFLATLALWVSSWVWMAGIAPVVTFVLLLFPSGRLLSSRWKPVAAAAGAGMALVIVGSR